MRFDEATFRSTHNSYSGAGRGTLREQLDGGVRCLEIDVHSDEFRARGYRIGHAWVGHEVANQGDNPDDDALRSWLNAVADWSEANAQHAPITVTLDLKDDLTEPESFDDGNPAALNALLAETFGERLLRPADRGPEWPELGDLEGRVICVLSGDRTTRLGYLRDGGLHPAVSVNSGGLVVEVHASGSGALWYWTGRREGDGVAWRRHGRYGSGSSPAVAVSDEGVVVSLQSGIGHGARSSVGRIDPESLEISWSGSEAAPLPYVASNPEPSVRFLDDGRVRVTYDTSDGRVAQHGQLAGETIEWDESERAAPATASDARFHRNHSESAGGTVTVVSVPDGDGGTRLLYGTEALDSVPVRYEQVAFVEGQIASPPRESDLAPVAGADDLHFCAAKATLGDNHDWAKGWRERAKPVRLWNFGEEAARNGRFVPSFPATDHPTAGWYTTYCDDNGAVGG